MSGILRKKALNGNCSNMVSLMCSKGATWHAFLRNLELY